MDFESISLTTRTQCQWLGLLRPHDLAVLFVQAREPLAGAPPSELASGLRELSWPRGSLERSEAWEAEARNPRAMVTVDAGDLETS